jgi:hypothetical protein
MGRKKKTGTAAAAAAPTVKRPHRSFKERLVERFVTFEEFLTKSRPAIIGVLPTTAAPISAIHDAAASLRARLAADLPADMPGARGRSMAVGDVVVFREKCKDLPKGLLDLTGKIVISQIPNALMVVLADEKGVTASFAAKTIQRVKPA